MLPTEIPSGPDIKKWNISLHYIDPKTSEKKSVYLGTYDTKDAAVSAGAYFSHWLSCAGKTSVERMENFWKELKSVRKHPNNMAH